MRELRVGDPANLATDIGPVIDADAQQMLDAHVAAMRGRGFRILTAGLPPGCAHGHFVAPAAIEIPSLDALDGEVFGPVLHILRFRSAELPGLIAAINAKGFGLTHGLHTRIDDTIATVEAGVAAGNIYVNRNIVGAVVGSQPFGGEGLSGTGPKAGGPFYLHRLARGTTPKLPDQIDHAVALPGPTGEANTWRLRPRGVVACLGPDAADVAAQSAAARAAGNKVVLTLDETCDAVLVAKADSALRQRVAARPGAIVSVIEADPAGAYPVWRLLKEQSISVNTAAAGGNAALLALGDEG